MGIRRRDNSSKAYTGYDGVIRNADQALKLAEEKGLITRPFDVFGFVKLLGIKLVFRPLDSDTSGKLAKVESGWEMIINALHHPKRQRFTAAHELGHYFLHRFSKKVFEDHAFFRNNHKSKEELEANEFAANLLMPKEQFIDYIRSQSNMINDISQEFDVSAMAVKVRADNLRRQGG